MTDDKTLIDSDHMYRKLIEVGDDWADKKAAYQALDAYTKTMLANHIHGRSEKVSIAAAEAAGLCSILYTDHLCAVAEANKAYLRAQVRYDSLRTLIELRRSEESSRRAEMRL